jgi:hypothetical protein
MLAGMRAASVCHLASLALGLSLAACGGTVEEDPDGAGGAGGSGSTSAATSSASASTVSATASSGDVSSSSTDVAATSVGSGGAGGTDGGPIEPKIVDVELYANCKPEVGPDPIGGSFVVAYENFGDEPASLDDLSASLVFATKVEGWVFPMTMQPLSSGPVPADDLVEVLHTKIATEGDSSFVCTFCGVEGTLSLRWIGSSGGEVSLDEPVVLACAL